MSVKVKVSNERMRQASNDAYSEMNDTKFVRIGSSKCELDSSNDIRSFLVIAQGANESFTLHRRYNWCLHWPMNEMKWSKYE